VVFVSRYDLVDEITVTGLSVRFTVIFTEEETVIVKLGEFVVVRELH